MKKNLVEGSIFTIGASLWWGIIGVFYFKFVSFASPLELTIHRTVWTALLLIFTSYYFSKWSEIKNIINKPNNLVILFITGVLISINWFTWLYAVSSNNLLDASLGYYIFPILSVFFGIVFLKEAYNKNKIISVILVVLSLIYLLYYPNILSPHQKTYLLEIQNLLSYTLSFLSNFSSYLTF